LIEQAPGQRFAVIGNKLKLTFAIFLRKIQKLM